MKKNKNKKPVIRNFVAKYSAQINRPATFRDRKNDYKRSPKHKKSFGDFSCLIAS